MKYECIDANCEGEKISLAHCCDCDYSGNKGKLDNFTVELGIEDDTWYKFEKDSGELTPLPDAAPSCPICGSRNFY